MLAQKFSNAPVGPGVYYFLSPENEVIYVGKAKSLRKRLFQYKNAHPRKKRDRKKRKILKNAKDLTWTPCESEAAAERLELSEIQKLRPRLNVASKFSNSYPVIVMNRFSLSYSTRVTAGSPLSELFGTFRSREMTRSSFNALGRILSYLVNVPPKTKRLLKRDRCRQFPIVALSVELSSALLHFFRGESNQALSICALALLDKPAAIRDRSKIEEDLKILNLFFSLEALKLAQAIKKTNYKGYFVPQVERDHLFLAARQKTPLDF